MYRNIGIEVIITDGSNENIDIRENEQDKQLKETYIYEIQNMNILTDVMIDNINNMSSEDKQQIIVTYNSIIKYISKSLFIENTFA
jgi:hypothetical protein